MKPILRCLLLLCLPRFAGAQMPDFPFESPVQNGIVSQSTITCMLQDKAGFLWFGTWSGLARYDGYQVRVFNASGGLDGNKITCLYEDTDGKIWVGTRNTGLFRFDHATEHFEAAHSALPAPNPLPAHNITSVFRDRSGKLWIGAEEGLFFFDATRQQLQSVPLQGKTRAPSENIYLYSMTQTPDGALWIAGSHGVFRGAENGGIPDFQQITLHAENPNLSQQSIEYQNFAYCVRQSRSQASILWVGTKSGLKKLDCSANPAAPLITSIEYQSGNNNSLSHNFVLDVQESGFPNPGAVWVATFNGLNLLQSQAEGYAVTRFFAETAAHPGLKSNNVRSLFLDRTDILWIGTDRGLNRLDPRSANFSLHPMRRAGQTISDPVTFLAATPEAVWAGAFGGGFFRIPLRQGEPAWNNIQHFTLTPPSASSVSNFVSAVLPDGQDRLWVLTQGAGAFRLNTKQLPPNGGLVHGAEQFLKGNGPQNVSDDYLMCGLVDSEGKVWLGSWDSGLNCYDPERREFLRFAESPEGHNFRLSPIIALLELRPGDLPGAQAADHFWMGTRGGGLFLIRFDAATRNIQVLRHFSVQNGGLRNNSLTSICRDRNGKIWFTTENGLDYWDAGLQKLVALQVNEALPSPIVQSLLEDDQHRLWVSTQNGLASIASQNQWKITTYNNRNGLRDRFFNAGAALYLPKGQILFGGNNGITAFQTASVQADSVLPTTVLTGLKLFNRNVNPGERTAEGFLLEKSLSTLPRLVLSHHENVVSIEFAGLHFSCPEQNRFAYKLEGFDPDWTYTDAAQRMAHYTNLPAGNYVFLVKSANSDGAWNPQAARLAIRVRPPWWQSAWAYTLYFMLLAGAIYGAFRLQMIRANYQHEIQLERLEKQKVEELAQLKTAFFTNISHELKTPLTLIVSPLEEMLRERSAADSRQRDILARMHRNGMRLLTMINQLLDIRKAEAGLMKIEAGQGNIVQFVAEICLAFRELAQQRQIQVHFQAANKQIQAWFDPDLLEKVFFNLLSNAIKFSSPGGEIFVDIGENASKHEFFVQVRDKGRGIPADKLPHIFEQFYQAENHDEAGIDGGSGIGLSLVKAIVAQHHGRIEVTSAPGEGATFCVWLPLGEAHFSDKEKTRGHLHGEALEAYTDALQSMEQVSATPHNSTPPEEAACVLVVEDNPDIREYLCSQLSRQYEVLCAENGEKGLEIALESLPDLVLCDISMPKMDGLTLTRHLKTRVETSHIPVVLLTARTSLIFKIDGLETGADDYITKPFNLHLLELRVKNLIESRRRLREKYARSLQQAHPETAAVEHLLAEMDESFLKQVHQIVEEHLEDSAFSIDDLARKLLMNRKQVYRKIKALTNLSPNEFIRSIRLQQAAQLLKTRRFTVAEVTYRVGFQDLKYFRERFREQFGVSPSEYE
ncbi:MAG: response regulator [Chitinophagales bacterium]|nr:response regulator [Chitinophagales bacterium]